MKLFGQSRKQLDFFHNALKEEILEKAPDLTEIQKTTIFQLIDDTFYGLEHSADELEENIISILGNRSRGIDWPGL